MREKASVENKRDAFIRLVEDVLFFVELLQAPSQVVHAMRVLSLQRRAIKLVSACGIVFPIAQNINEVSALLMIQYLVTI